MLYCLLFKLILFFSWLTWNWGFFFDDLTSTPYTQSCNEKLRPQKKTKNTPGCRLRWIFWRHEGCWEERYHCQRKEEGKLAFKKKMTYTRSQSRACFGRHADDRHGFSYKDCIWQMDYSLPLETAGERTGTSQAFSAKRREKSREHCH